MERAAPTDRRLLAAARSLYHGRKREAVLQGRIATAEQDLTAWMLASGTTQALLGLFELHLAEGELVVAKHDVPDSAQLMFPQLAPPPTPEQLGFGAEEDPPLSRIADHPVPLRQVERLAGLSEGELASLARVVLASLAAAEVAPLLARHEAGMVITAPRMVYDLLGPEMSMLSQEQLRTLPLTTRHALLGNHLVYQGTVSQSPVRTAEVFRPAVLQQAPAMIVAHNHPSGDPTPSADDLQLTRQLAEAGSLLGVRLVDHIVIASSGFYSFRESGHIPPAPTDRNTLSDNTTSPTIDLYDEDRA